MIWVLVALSVLIAAGLVYQHRGSARDRRDFPAPGEWLDAGGHRVHVSCLGSGTPAVVFESGIAASSVSWALVQPRVAEFTRACAYDRAGLAWSDAASVARTFDRIVEEFGAVVAHAAPAGPSVLVGHSFGTFVVRAWAARHPDRVAGLVLVDPPTEWLQMTPSRARLLRGGRQLSAVGALLAHVGVVRLCLALLSGGRPATPRQFSRLLGPTAAATLERLVGEVRKLPPALHPVVQAHWSQPKCFHAMADYLDALAREGTAIAALAPPRDVPTVVISSGRQSHEQIARHRDLAAATARGRHLIAQQSGHWVQFDEPELIVGAIRDMARG